MDRPRRDSRQHDGITVRGMSQPTFATKSAPNGHRRRLGECPLFVVDQKWLASGQNDAIDPQETLAVPTGKPVLTVSTDPFESIR